MTKNYRYSISRVFWVILSLNIFLGIFVFIFFIVAPVSDKTQIAEEMFTWKTVISNCSRIIFTTIFYFLTINWFYALMVEKKGVED